MVNSNHPASLLQRLLSCPPWIKLRTIEYNGRDAPVSHKTRLDPKFVIQVIDTWIERNPGEEFTVVQLQREISLPNSQRDYIRDHLAAHPMVYIAREVKFKRNSDESVRTFYKVRKHESK